MYTQKKILIIEDEEFQRKAIHDYLKQKDFAIFEAADGIEGIEMALRIRPDVILLDVRMPKMDGMTMMHNLRKDPWGKNAAIIILTNYDTNDIQLLQITNDHPSYYLIKANSPLKDIFEKIEELIELKQKEEKPTE